jgi:signal transduction histidine kinase
MRIKHKLFILVGILTVILTVILIINQLLIYQAQKNYSELKEGVEPAIHVLNDFLSVNDELSLLINNRVYSYEYSGAANKVKSIVEVEFPYLQEEVSQLKNNLAPGDKRQELIDKITAEANVLLNVIKKLEPLLETIDDFRNPIKIKEARNIVNKEAYPMYLVLGADIHKLQSQYNEQYEWHQKSHVKSLEAASRLILIVGLIGIVTGLIVSYRIIRSILQSILKLGNLANEVSSGKYGIQIPLEGNSELTTLSSSLNVMSKSLEKSFKEKRIKLEELQQIAYIATHDLKSPMISIEGHFEYLKMQLEEKDEFTEESIKYVDKGIKQFYSTLDSLARAIKVKEGEISLEAINLGEVVLETINNFEGEVKKHKGKVQSNVKEGSKLMVLGTKVYLDSILQNLISNAIKYRSKERAVNVDIFVNEYPETIEMIIRDNGLGIDLNLNREMVFKMFRRFHEHEQGSGMGLFMVKTMIEKMNGSIAIDSQVGVGTTFTIIFKKINE